MLNVASGMPAAGPHNYSGIRNNLRCLAELEYFPWKSCFSAFTWKNGSHWKSCTLTFHKTVYFPAQITWKNMPENVLISSLTLSDSRNKREAALLYILLLPTAKYKPFFSFLATIHPQNIFLTFIFKIIKRCVSFSNVFPRNQLTSRYFEERL